MRYRLNRIPKLFVKSRHVKLVLLVGLLLLVILCGVSYSALVSEGAIDSIKFAATTSINTYMNLSVSDFLEDNPDFTSSIVTPGNSSGELTYTANTAVLEEAEQEIHERLRSYLLRNDVIRVRIPIGTLTGNTFLSGKGFKVSVSAYAIPAVSSEIEWAVASGGINQTMYTATLTLRVECQIIFGSCTDTVFSEVKKNLFTQIIVGDVPLGAT